MRNSAYETEQVNQQPLRHISILFLELDTFYTFCCSIQLSYVRILVRTAGFEPTTHRPFASIKTLLLLVSKQNEEAHHIEPW